MKEKQKNVVCSNRSRFNSVFCLVWCWNVSTFALSMYFELKQTFLKRFVWNKTRIGLGKRSKIGLGQLVLFHAIKIDSWKTTFNHALGKNKKTDTSTSPQAICNNKNVVLLKVQSTYKSKRTFKHKILNENGKFMEESRKKHSDFFFG